MKRIKSLLKIAGMKFEFENLEVRPLSVNATKDTTMEESNCRILEANLS